jgi:hypothetical protein
MTVIPFTTVYTLGEGINMYTTECNQRRGPQGEFRDQYSANIIALTKEFVDKFGDSMNKFKKRDSYNYTFNYIRDFCSAYVDSYTDKREMVELRNT